MANETRYYDTPYTFISPVRHFKSNDPYYYEVDNIPVKQLEESQNFLKDQVDGIISRQNNKQDIEIDRSGFSELKPYATGDDRKIRVKPGKFTARINDGYTLTPLQVIEQVGGYSNYKDAGGISDLNTWRVETNIGTYVSGVLNEFQQGLLGDALNMNGLAERAFVFPVWDEDGFHLAKGFDISGTTTPGYSQFDDDFSADDRPPYPNFVGTLLKNSTPETTRDLILIKNVFDEDASTEPEGNQQGRVEAEFIRRWRGAIRTSIVDVPEELVVPVPDFDSNDFFYTDEAGTRQSLAANQRIDLLFIYSKAVDAESTTIPSFDANGSPTVLTEPALGILKGAGIGISRETASNDENADDRVSLQTLDGTPIMLAHPGDENGNNTGFTTEAGVIKGSFPSPDDLMNLAPLLSEQLETDAFQLIGQSILPVAYIRVQSPGGPIADLITDEDVIDIRPFFRTTELAYNERAGIAAATPQISIANPVVSEANLEKVRKEVVATFDGRISNIEGSLGVVEEEIGGATRPRTIATGNVLGGYWGPEGAMMNRARSNAAGSLGNATMNQLADLVEAEVGLPAGSVPYTGDWDKARWYAEGGYTGLAINDKINVCMPSVVENGGPGGNNRWLPPWQSGRVNGQVSSVAALRSEFGSESFSLFQFQDDAFAVNGGVPVAGTNSLTIRALIAQGITTSSRNPFGNLPGSTTSFSSSLLRKIFSSRDVTIYFVTKRIKLNLEATPWVDDYQVKVNLLNCVPLTFNNASQPQGEPLPTSQASNVWIQKHKEYFTICVAWAGPRAIFGPGAHRFFPWANRNNADKFVGFAHPQAYLLGGGSFGNNGSNPVGGSENISETSRDESFERMVNNDSTGDRIPSTSNKFTESNYFSPVKPLVYPSVQWEVVGIPGSFMAESAGGDGTRMRQKDPTIKCR
jgi:hypothetical protein